MPCASNRSRSSRSSRAARNRSKTPVRCVTLVGSGVIVGRKFGFRGSRGSGSSSDSAGFSRIGSDAPPLFAFRNSEAAGLRNQMIDDPHVGQLMKALARLFFARRSSCSSEQPANGQGTAGMGSHSSHAPRTLCVGEPEPADPDMSLRDKMLYAPPRNTCTRTPRFAWRGVSPREYAPFPANAPSRHAHPLAFRPSRIDLKRSTSQTMSALNVGVCDYSMWESGKDMYDMYIYICVTYTLSENLHLPVRVFRNRGRLELTGGGGGGRRERVV